MTAEQITRSIERRFEELDAEKASLKDVYGVLIAGDPQAALAALEKKRKEKG